MQLRIVKECLASAAVQTLVILICGSASAVLLPETSQNVSVTKETASNSRHLPLSSSSQFWIDKLTRKLSPFMSILSLWNEKCWSATYDQGTCFPMNHCLQKGGSIVGNCAGGFGVCCLFLYSCGTRTERNLTYFSNREFPEVSQGWDTCSHSVTKLDGVCQLRLDFEIFEIQQPDHHGNCISDSFSVHGGDIRLPLLCGEMSGHHLYLPIGYSPEIELVLNLGASNAWRRWKIKVTKIKCSSMTIAPGGCLQYYKELEGAATSFNYFVDKDSNLNNLNYGVCVRRETGYCAIQWHKCGHHRRRKRRNVTGNMKNVTVETNQRPSRLLGGANALPGVESSGANELGSVGSACGFLWTDQLHNNVTMEQLVRCLRLLGILGRGMQDLSNSLVTTSTSTTPISIYPWENIEYDTGLERKDVLEKVTVGTKVKTWHPSRPTVLPPTSGIQFKVKGQPWYSDKHQKVPATLTRPKYKGTVKPKLPLIQRKPKPGGYLSPKPPKVQPKPPYPKIKVKPPRRKPKPKPPKLHAKKPWHAKKNDTKCDKKIIPIPFPIPILPVVAIPFPIGGGGGGGGGGGHGHDDGHDGWGWDGSVVSTLEPYLIRVATDWKKENGLSGFCVTWQQIPCDDWYSEGSHVEHDDWSPW